MRCTGAGDRPVRHEVDIVVRRSTLDPFHSTTGARSSRSGAPDVGVDVAEVRQQCPGGGRELLRSARVARPRFDIAPQDPWRRSMASRHG
jgi:hypothetical protein